MAYKEILPQTNLDAVDIRDTIGCPSNNLADYCTKAKSGGIGGYAFRIVENGHLPSDGYLIEDASPYFNIWSNNSPGEWVMLDRPTSSVPPKEYKFRLKRNHYGNIEIKGKLFDSRSYCFDMGAYRGYRHYSSAPRIIHQYTNGSINISATNGVENILRFQFDLGSYNWGAVTDGSNHNVKMKIISNRTVIATQSKAFNDPNDRFEIPVTRNQLSNTIEAQMWSCSGSDELAYFPFVNPLIFNVNLVYNWFQVGDITIYDYYDEPVNDYYIAIYGSAKDAATLNLGGVLRNDFGIDSRTFSVQPKIRGTNIPVSNGEFHFDALRQNQDLGDFFIALNLNSTHIVDIVIKQR